jgi:hypothetical protein
MSWREKIKNWLKHPLFTAVAGTVAGAFITNNVKTHDVVTYNNIGNYIEDLMVVPGLVDEKVLSLETPFEQLEAIADKMSETNQGHNELLGEKESLAMEVEQLKSEIEQLKEKKVAELSSPELKIKGEDTNTTFTDYMAIVDGRRYYLEGFLNTFLPDEISNDEGVVQYGKDMPEKVNVISEGLTYDESNLVVHKGETSFSMGTENYFFGITTNGCPGGKVNIECDGKYSELSFVLGHVNDSGDADYTLTVSYLDANGTFIESRSIEMDEKMPILTYNVPIYNTRTVQITSKWHGGVGATYGLVDIYLIK